jgi:nicotinamidase-related amidase
MKSALLLIDVINDLAFPRGKRLLKYALPAAKRLTRLKQRATAAGVPVVYVNDNFGRWRSDFRHQVSHCLSESCLGRELAVLLAPDESDFFVLKPKHSGFYSTTLDVLLKSLEVNTLVLAGFATDICVLYTANDAYMRDYRLVVVSDGVAAEEPAWNRSALAQMARQLRAEIKPARSIHFRRHEPI